VTDWLNNLEWGLVDSSWQQLLLALLLAFLIGQVAGFVYAWTHRSMSYSQTFAMALVVLPVLTALMMSLMSNSIVVAFGFLAVFAVVRFRNVLKDTRDTAFVLWVLVEGMAVGVGKHSTALIGMIVIGLIMIYLWASAFGSRNRFDAILSMQLAGEVDDILDALSPVFLRHAFRTQQTSVRQIQADCVDIGYQLVLRNPARGSELEAELKQVPGVQRANVQIRAFEEEI
jgi:hypothetical protein